MRWSLPLGNQPKLSKEYAVKINQPITAKNTRLSEKLDEIITGKERKHIPVRASNTDIDLPVYRLPDNNGVHIGFNPPKPSEFGYGVNDD